MTTEKREQWRCPVCNQRLAVLKSAEAGERQIAKHEQSQRHLDAASLLAMVDAQSGHR